MPDFEARTTIAWDAGRDGYFVHTVWAMDGVGPENAADRGPDKIFFINLIKADATMVFLGNYNHIPTGGRIRASSVAHEQLKLVLGLTARDRRDLHAHPGRKMTVAEIRGRRGRAGDAGAPEGDAVESGVGVDAVEEIRTPLARITRSDVVNEATKAALKDYVGMQDADRMRDALDAFLTRTPNGGSTRRFLQLQNLRADAIAVTPKHTLPDGRPDHAKGYDITLTCSPLDAPRSW